MLRKYLDCQRPLTDHRHICLAPDGLPPGAGEFYKKNKRLPEMLVMYRDGVSEGQVQPLAGTTHRTCVSRSSKCSTDACQGLMLVMCHDGVSRARRRLSHENLVAPVSPARNERWRQCACQLMR